MINNNADHIKQKKLEKYDVIIIGGGASGLFVVNMLHELFKKTNNRDLLRSKKKVLIIEKNNQCGKKILVSGGGRCNYSNLNLSAKDFLSSSISEKRLNKILNFYPQNNVVKLFKKWGINPIEKDRGKLFSSKKSIGVQTELLAHALQKNDYLDCRILYKTQLQSSDINYKIINTLKDQSQAKDETSSDTKIEYIIDCKGNRLLSTNLIVASGGLSFPKIGATNLGYLIAQKFNHKVCKLKPGLVPLAFKTSWNKISGISCLAQLTSNNYSIIDNLLFTHNGLSGPAILRISSHLNINLNDNNIEKCSFLINFLPNCQFDLIIQNARNSGGRKSIKNLLKSLLPSSMVDYFFVYYKLSEQKIAEISKKDLLKIKEMFCANVVEVVDTLGYNKAEVTCGGVSMEELKDSLESKKYSGLFFIGEVCDVTGDLGGFNFAWPWASAYSASVECFDKLTKNRKN